MNLLIIPLRNRKGVCKNRDDDDSGKARSLTIHKQQTNKKALADSPCTAKALISSGLCPSAVKRKGKSHHVLFPR
jgi:hypothetical protein